MPVPYFIIFPLFFLQGKWTADAVNGGPYDGGTIDPEKWNVMLEDYYRARGWNAETGIPARATLAMLGLNDVTDDLQRRGFATG